MDFSKRNFWQKEQRGTILNLKKQDKDIRKDALDSVYPIFRRCPFKDRSIVHPGYGEDPDNKSMVFSDINEELHCFYAIRNRFGFEVINLRHLAQWDFDQQQLHDRAMKNFRKLILTDLNVYGDSSGIMFKLDGNLEAGLMLIDEIWEQIEQQLGERVVIAVPSRGVVVATGESDFTTIATLDTLVQGIYNEGGYPLSRKWFVREEGKWMIFDPHAAELT